MKQPLRLRFATLRAGQSLLELLIAFFVITIGLLSAVTLVFSNLALVERDADEVVAVNLAREGVEFAKNIRDSNWLAGMDFDAGLYNPSDQTATPIWEGVSAPLSLDFTADNFTHERTKIIKTSNGLLINRPAPSGVTYTDTSYQRLMTFRQICYDDALRTYTISPAPCVGRRVGIRVESRVRSSRKGRTKDVVMYEDLYDWR